MHVAVSTFAVLTSHLTFIQFMKTPTLIVRLGGLYLLTTATIALIQIGKMHAMQVTIPGLPSVHIPQNPVLDDMRIYMWLAVVVGLVATLFAGFLARLLTFDAEQPGRAVDLTDRMLRR